MRKFELEQEVERLGKALLRAKSKIKKLSAQSIEYNNFVKSRNREIKRLTRSNKKLLSKYEIINDNEVKINDLEMKNSELEEELHKAEKQNALLRQSIELTRASSTDPRYDTLKKRQ